jgi:hypothetical protein
LKFQKQVVKMRTASRLGSIASFCESEHIYVILLLSDLFSRLSISLPVDRGFIVQHIILRPQPFCCLVTVYRIKSSLFGTEAVNNRSVVNGKINTHDYYNKIISLTFIFTKKKLRTTGSFATVFCRLRAQSSVCGQNMMQNKCDVHPLIRTRWNIRQCFLGRRITFHNFTVLLGQHLTRNFHFVLVTNSLTSPR